MPSCLRPTSPRSCSRKVTPSLARGWKEYTSHCSDRSSTRAAVKFRMGATCALGIVPVIATSPAAPAPPSKEKARLRLIQDLRGKKSATKLALLCATRQIKFVFVLTQQGRKNKKPWGYSCENNGFKGEGKGNKVAKAQSASVDVRKDRTRRYYS